MSNIIPFPADKARSVIDRVVAKMDEAEALDAKRAATARDLEREMAKFEFHARRATSMREASLYVQLRNDAMKKLGGGK